MQGSQPSTNLFPLGDDRGRGLSNMTVYSSIGLFLLVFWLTVEPLLF